MLLDLSPLRVSRDYRLLFFGQLVSFFGSMITFVVVPWQMYQLTRSNAMVGYIALAEFVPMVSLAFVGGALADYVDKRKMLRFTEIGQTVLTGGLVLNSMLSQPSIPVLFIIVALHAGLAARALGRHDGCDVGARDAGEVGHLGPPIRLRRTRGG